jgi:hypothetical protein
LVNSNANTTIQSSIIILQKCLKPHYFNLFLGLTARAINVKDPKAPDASNPANHTFVVGNMSFLEGVHYWEFICPISCDSMGKL